MTHQNLSIRSSSTVRACRPAIVLVRLGAVAMAALGGVTADAAINTWFQNANLGTGGNWSAASAPSGSGNTGSYQDGLFASPVLTGTASAGTSNLYFQSVNITNGSAYRILAGSTNTFNFRVGQTVSGTAGEGTAFTNAVSGSAQDLVYLANNSSLIITGTTDSSPSVGSNFNLRSYGNLRILAGSTFTTEGPVTMSSSTFTLTKLGGGKMVMAGANTYTGLTTVSEGTLEHNANNVMADSAPITVNGGLWDLKSFSDTVGTVTLSSGTIAGSGGLTIKNDSQFTGGTISANLTGTSGFALPTGAGTVVFSGVNTFSGTAKISAGTLRAASPNALSSSATLNSGGSTSDSSTLDFGSPSLSYQMSALGVGGIMRFTSSSGSASRITFQATSGNGFSGSAGTKILDADANSTVVVTGTFDLASSAITQTRTGRLQGAGNFTFNGPVIASGTAGSFTAGISMQGTGTTTLNAANTYSGTTEVIAGTLVLGSANALGDGTSGTVLSGGRIDVNGLSLPSFETLTQSGAGALVNTNTGTQATWAGSVTTSGTFAVGGAGNLAISGNLSGAGNVSKTGAGSVTLASAAYSGTTGVTSGTLTFGPGSSMNSAGAINVTAGAVLGVQTALAHDITGSGLISIGSTGTLAASSIGTNGLSLVGSGASTATFTNTGSSLTGLGPISLGGSSNLAFSTTGALVSAGAVSISGTGNLLTVSGVTTAGNTYSLLSGTSLANAGTVSLTGAAVGNQTILLGGSTTVGRTTYNFNQTATALQLAVTGTTFNLAWNGGASGAWDYSAANWQKDGTGSNIAFVANDNATLGTAAAVAVDAGGITAGTVTINNASGSVDLAGGAVAATSITKAGNGTATIASTVIAAQGVSVSAGSFTVNATTTVSAGGVTVSGGVATLNNPSSITGGITVTGGTAAFNAANTVSGAVSASGGGAISLGDAGGVGSGSIALDNGILTSSLVSPTITNAVALGSGGGTVSGASPLTLSGAITGPGTLTKTGAGELTVSGALGTSSTGVAVSVAAGGAARLTGAATKWLSTTATGTVNGTLTLDNATLVLKTGTALTGTGSIVLVGASTITGTTTSVSTIATPISGAGSLSFGASSAGNSAASTYVTLSGSNSYSGGTTLNQNVGMGSNTAFGTGPIIATRTDSFSRINNVTNGPLTLANNVSTGAGNVFSITGANPIQLTGTITGSGLIRSSNGGIIDLTQQTAATMLNTGSVDIGSSGMIQVAGSANLGSLTAILVSGTPGSTLKAQGNTGSITQPVKIGATNNNPCAFTVDTNGYAVTLAGVIQNLNTGTGGGLTKTGAGTLTLTNANTYTGATAVSAGTLLVNGSLYAGATGATSVSAAAVLGGSGTIGGGVFFAAGANFRFDAASILSVTGGTVSFGGFGVSNVLGLDSSTPEGTYTLISGAVDFSNVTNVGAANAVSIGGTKTAYLQQGSLQLVVVPEPTSAVAVMAAGLAAALVVRQRKARV